MTYEAIYFTSPLFPDLELHAAKKLTVVTHEGHGDRIWSTPLQADGTPAPAVMDDEGREINADSSTRTIARMTSHASMQKASKSTTTTRLSSITFLSRALPQSK